jgi:hypothetical protein
MPWQDNLLTSRDAIRGLIHQTQRIAVLGIKTERQSFQPAFYVPAYLANAGFEIIPVPVYFPEVTQILGRPVYSRLIDIPGEIDLGGPKTLTQIDVDGLADRTEERRRRFPAVRAWAKRNQQKCIRALIASASEI